MHTDWLCERNMRGNSITEKSMDRAQTCPVVKLRRQQNIARRIFFLQTANCGHRNDPAHIQRTQRVNVGAMIQFMRQDPMAASVTWQEIDLPSTHPAPNQHVRRCPKRSFDLMLGHIVQLFYLIETAAADDPDGRRLVVHMCDD